MDPTRLSMEQGKEFLKQLGIPQRDLDLMTEKWVVVAALEVMLRFPLMPGEDPSARCVSSRTRQPSGARPPTAVRRHEDQEERESNNPSLREKDQKPEGLAGDCIYQRPPRPPIAQNMKKLQRGPVGQRNPSPEEVYTRVKCKNCGAFRHLASSRRCPVKCWAWCLAPQPLGSSKNENLEPKRPQDLQIPGSFHRTDSRREPRQRCRITGPGEQKREARPLRPPVRRPQKQQSSGKEPTDVGAHLRRPTRPLPVQTNTKPSVLGPVPTGQPPVMTPDMRSTLPLSKAPEVHACEPAQRCGVDLPCQALKSSCQDPPLIAKLTASRPDVVSPDVPQPARKTLAQTEAKHPPVASRPHPQPIVGRCGQNAKLGIQAPGKTSPQVALQTCQNPPKKARFGLF
ncbi:protein FAM90A27P-like isoform X1 [Leptonychotes weddellii]|uniref:Protein FAM90A27P-like isoform X1 n=1 Tax=Leptonychotes weddellii TaxID=9713 RepID=A0A7F8PYC7_LEPWE|nr:protein FAM90A27P-like isoform X1 [Leptonychotes weddellii]XP_030873188.1 protein FAM90A27P-like isoform X1 [Leptonychotes weddellii]